jgi:hypothetical protein
MPEQAVLYVVHSRLAGRRRQIGGLVNSEVGYGGIYGFPLRFAPSALIF